MRGELVRGQTLHVPVELPDVGGSISVRSADAAAARLTAGDGDVRLATFGDGTLRFDNLPEATYRLELCADAGCGSPTRSWDALRVRRLETTYVTADEPAAPQPE